MAKLSKRRKAEKTALDTVKTYELKEAIALVKKSAIAKFDETIDICMNLGVDPKHSDQMVRGVVAMPSGTGKNVRVAVFAKGDKVKEAQDAGADLVGSDELIEQIQKGDIKFDRCIASPDMMGVVGRVAKILGPKGLMPNPKLGTVTPNVGEAVKSAKAGQVEFRVEKAGIIHAGIGKASFSEDALEANIRAFYDAVSKAKPSGAKGIYIKRVGISSSMGTGLKIDPSNIAA